MDAPTCSRILVVEDGIEAQEFTSRVLRLHGNFSFEIAATAEAAFQKLEQGTFDVILLDLGLPDMDGLEVCRHLKEDPRTVDIPVLMLTGRASAADKIAGLEMGADDYLAKPYDPGELMARLHVILRRREKVRSAKPFHSTELGLSLEASARSVTLHGQPLKLTAREFDLLALLMRSPGEAVSREEIAQLIWNKPAAESTRSLETHIWSLRTKLKEVGTHIETVGKVGYRFNP